ncbi:hypothetical protein [Streptomyces sp. st170]|uniref:hypothetical protein n=1 Tax=Streptomyces sp. st170 TaxID=1828058 RepID=UPI000BF1AAAC|nr:hypothetical protein [Streptomyces sp. st170]
MDALTKRLSQAADYLKRESDAALQELLAETFCAVHSSKGGVGELDRRGEGFAFPPPGGDPRPAHLSTKEEQRTKGQKELATLLENDRKGLADGRALRRIAELTELFDDEQLAQVWWHRAALEGDPVAIMMLGDD